MKKKHGGARRNAGRKPTVPGEPFKRVCVSLDERTVRLLKVLGDGELSKGVRVAADAAYDLWQKRGPH